METLQQQINHHINLIHRYQRSDLRWNHACRVCDILTDIWGVYYGELSNEAFAAGWGIVLDDDTFILKTDYSLVLTRLITTVYKATNDSKRFAFCTYLETSPTIVSIQETPNGLVRETDTQAPLYLDEDQDRIVNNMTAAISSLNTWLKKVVVDLITNPGHYGEQRVEVVATALQFFLGSGFYARRFKSDLVELDENRLVSYTNAYNEAFPNLDELPFIESQEFVAFRRAFEATKNLFQNLNMGRAIEIYMARKAENTQMLQGNRIDRQAFNDRMGDATSDYIVQSSLENDQRHDELRRDITQLRNDMNLLRNDMNGRLDILFRHLGINEQ